MVVSPQQQITPQQIGTGIGPLIPLPSSGVPSLRFGNGMGIGNNQMNLGQTQNQNPQAFGLNNFGTNGKYNSGNRRSFNFS